MFALHGLHSADKLGPLVDGESTRGANFRGNPRLTAGATIKESLIVAPAVRPASYGHAVASLINSNCSMGQ